MTRLVREYTGEFGAFFQKEATKSMDMFSKAYVTDGIVRWQSNDRVPPTDLLELWRYGNKSFDYDKSLKAQQEETSQSLRAYRQFRSTHGYSDEEKAEMRAAFGNETVVDVITGRPVY